MSRERVHEHFAVKALWCVIDQASGQRPSWAKCLAVALAEEKVVVAGGGIQGNPKEKRDQHQKQGNEAKNAPQMPQQRAALRNSSAHVDQLAANQAYGLRDKRP